jgi:parvulin-like peptidyl-prolyl isomerase
MHHVPRRRDFMKLWRKLVPVLILAVTACDGASGPSSSTVVAEAAGVELEGRVVAEMLAPQTELPSQPEIVEALADLWAQYFLLAKASMEDTTLAQIDLTPIVARQIESDMVAQLRDVAIQVDTAITEDELRDRFASEAPGSQVRARHILLQFPDGATDAQTDSVRALANEIRDRLVAGEDFEALAQTYSADPGTAATGGDLGTFGRNEMVPPFEEAAFSLQEGEISDVVETAFGLHLIRVDERTIPSFEERRDQFRVQLQNRMVMEAESTYVADLVEQAGLETDSAGFELIRELAADPAMNLSSRALNRTLVEYDRGAYTLGEFRGWLLTSAPNIPAQIEAASDPQLDNLLQSLSRSELLVNQARAEGIEVPQERQDSLADGILAGVKGISQQLGFFGIEIAEGETADEAADRYVRDLLNQVVRDERQIFPLQTVGFALKEQYGARIYKPALAGAVDLLNELRAAPAAETDVPAEEPAEVAPPDTAGTGG